MPPMSMYQLPDGEGNLTTSVTDVALLAQAVNSLPIEGSSQFYSLLVCLASRGEPSRLITLTHGSSYQTTSPTGLSIIAIPQRVI